MPHAVRWLALLTCLPLLPGCGEEDFPEGVMELTSGLETDPWDGVARTEVSRVSSDGTVTELIEAPGVVESFKLGKSGVGSYRIEGFDADGDLRVSGASMPMAAAGLAARTIPLLVGTAGEFARPTLLEHVPGASPRLAPFGDRWVLVVGAGAADDGRVETDLFDVGFWRALSDPPRLPCPGDPCRVESLSVTQDNYAILIGPGGAKWFDLELQGFDDLVLPEGTSPEELSGGDVIQRPDGGAYLVAGTRKGEPSAAVLEIEPDGFLVRRDMLVPRQGAAAAWVDGRGLVVIGGSESGAGVELLPDGASAFVSLPFPSDPTYGAALAVHDSSRIERLGGISLADGLHQPSVMYELGCGSDCEATPSGDALELEAVQAHVLPETDSTIFIGTDSFGISRCYSHTPEGLLELPALRDERRWASAIVLATGQLGVFGGVDSEDSAVVSVETLLQL